MSHATADEVAAAEVPASEVPVPEELAAPGLLTRSTSWAPSVIGPDGLAGQEPGGLRGAVMPKGMVPLAPTLMPPTKVVWSEPWY